LGRGTRVTLYLPRAYARPEQRVAEPAVESGVSGTALLVEDNPDVAEVSVTLIEQLGYEVETATDAATALETLESLSVDLVVSDIIMAGSMDGLGLARVIRQRRPALPII